MRRILCIFWLWMPFFLKSQDTMRLEIVQQQLGIHPQQDTTRVNLLNQLAWHSGLPPAQRDSLLSEALSLSKKLNYAKGVANVFSIQSFLLEKSKVVQVARQAVEWAQKSKDPETQVWALRAYGQAMLYTSNGVDAIVPFKQALAIAQGTGNLLLIMYGQLNFVDYYKTVYANYPLALQWSLDALQTAERSGKPNQLSLAYRNVGSVYLLSGDQEKALENMQKALAASRQAGNVQIEQFTLNDIGEQYRVMGKYPQALQAYSQAAKLIKDQFNLELNQSNVANVYERMGEDKLAMQYGFQALQGAIAQEDTIGISWIYNTLSRACLHSGKNDSAIWYAQKGYDYARQTNVLEYIRDNAEALANAYEQNHAYEKAFYFFKTFITFRDSIINNEVTNKSNLAQYNYDLAKKQTEIEVLNKSKQLQQEKARRQQSVLVAVITVLVFISIIVVLLYRNNRQRQKALVQLGKQNKEVQDQRDEKEKALLELKATQAQLIQSEKMASLGELTAGIAHEIQNPLNFVNNFSDISKELLEEMQQALQQNDKEEALAIADDVKENLDKIALHGRRADGIVKGMLQHSRTSTGKKELTDINALADEYLRLSYHGLRAKDKNFNARLETSYDENVGNVAVLPQELGRVLLNLLNNAFYAVNEKKKLLGSPYEPTVFVSTQKLDGKILIAVKDNGTGVPQKALDKIFQPFFTTKPTGQGTGLGLSMSYDIITKRHGGELKVESTEGEGARFIIILPTALS